LFAASTLSISLLSPSKPILLLSVAMPSSVTGGAGWAAIGGWLG
jgi:hypothetical protein